MMLADAVANIKEGKYKEFSMTDEERYELYIAAWLHDCGKVATPPHVVDKGTKLETIFDRIELIKTRMELLKRDAEIAFLKRQLKGGVSEEYDETYLKTLRKIDDNMKFIEKCNVGGEYMEEELQEKVRSIGATQLFMNGESQNLLTDEEISNLNIPKGTLLPEEREIINDHIVITIEMLEQLPYPKNLRNVPEFAGGHHEKMDGTGYPKGLNESQMSTQAKIMAIADIYEALTAADRPYKDGKKLSQAMRIMGFMKNDFHIDEDLFEIFVTSGVYKKYAEKHVAKNQIDEVDELSVIGKKMNKKLLDKKYMRNEIFTIMDNVKCVLESGISIDDFLDETNIFDEWEHIIPEKEYPIFVMAVLNNIRKESIIETILVSIFSNSDEKNMHDSFAHQKKKFKSHLGELPFN